jgi:hypothetical protein
MTDRTTKPSTGHGLLSPAQRGAGELTAGDMLALILSGRLTCPLLTAAAVSPGTAQPHPVEGVF